MGGALERALAAFRGRFGAEPRWAARAPGRVNLIGEHTDYNGGFVLPITIDRACLAVGGPAAAGELTRVVAADLGIERELDLSADLRAVESESARDIRRGSPESYIAGVLGLWVREIGPLPQLRIAVASDVPLGGGLSSSAAVEVAVATLLERVSGRELEKPAKAKLCQRAEHEFAGVPCGIMDQFASCMGRSGHALLIDCREETATPVELPRECAWLVVNSHVRHALAGGEYAKRRALCEEAARLCGVRSLRELAMPLLESRRDCLSVEQYGCARHVVSENGRVLRMAEMLEGGGLEAAGRLMVESHASLRDDFRVSCAEVDTIVDALVNCEGVYGARMTGAGFGGCAVALIEQTRAAEVQQRVLAAYRRVHGRAGDAFLVSAAPGAAQIRV